MRLSVECAFPHLGKRGAGSRKSAFCTLGLTEKRTLAAPPGRTSRKGAFWLGRHLQNASLREAPHQKAHSGGSGARRVRLSVTSNPRMRFFVECAFPHLGKRGVGSRKSAFWQVGSRKSAVWLAPAEHTSRKSAPCTSGLTEKRTLAAPPGRTSPKDALWRFWSSQSASFRDVKLQNALFRRMRFFSPAQTRRRLTEKRSLHRRPHGKAHFGRAPGTYLTKRRTLAGASPPECVST